MTKLVKPVFPMSEEEHDKYVDLAWNNGKMSIQEQKVREIIDKEVMQYSTGVMVAPTNIDPFVQKIGVHFRFNDEVEANVQMFFNMPLGILYSIISQKFVNGEEGIELYYSDDKGGLDQLNKDLLGYAGINNLPEELKTEVFTCEFCSDGTDEYGKSLFREELKLGNATIADVDVYIGSEDNMEMLITNSTDEVIAKQVMKIKYCPYCGRKLGGTE